MNGKLIGIYICPQATELPHSVDAAEARTRTGLVGDRYFSGAGTFSDSEPKGPGRELTLIEKEALEHVRKNDGIDISAEEARRNLLTEGVELNGYVGKEFYVGDVLLKGIRLCPPCTHLDKVTGKKLLKPLDNRGGLRAAILSDGIVRVGDSIRLAQPE